MGGFPWNAMSGLRAFCSFGGISPGAFREENNGTGFESTLAGSGFRLCLKMFSFAHPLCLFYFMVKDAHAKIE